MCIIVVILQSRVGGHGKSSYKITIIKGRHGTKTKTSVTRVGILELLFESREGRPQGLWELEEDLVEEQHGLLTEVRLSGAELQGRTWEEVNGSSLG